jgi:hypothetical protein
LIELTDFQNFELSVAMTSATAKAVRRQFENDHRQEDLTFATWRPSFGLERITAIVGDLIPPRAGDRFQHGNASFSGDYVRRALTQVPTGAGLVFIHSHLGPGWQGMSLDDVVAERDRLAGPAGGRGLPLLGLTWGTDGSFSGRLWVRAGRHQYQRFEAASTRVVGERLHLSFHPQLRPKSVAGPALVATVSVWGERVQGDLSRARVGIIGLGSVGSIVAEALARSGISRFVLIDPDRIEDRNLDRTAGARREDADVHAPKVSVAERSIRAAHTAAAIEVISYVGTLLSQEGLRRALDCDVIISCVDRPWPRHVLNAMSYSHLIPLIDGGILALVSGGRLVHADWRVHTACPERACLVCMGALELGDVQLDMAGKLDDPDYIKGLPEAVRERLGRRNIYAFSLGVASHEVLHLAGLISGDKRISGIGPQTYHCYPGEMTVVSTSACKDGCEYATLTATAADLSGNLEPLR